MTAISPERIAEIVAKANELFNDECGTDWFAWFSSLPEADVEATAVSVPWELILVDGSALDYSPGKCCWSHRPIEVAR